MNPKYWQWFLAILVLVAGVGGAVGLVAIKPTPPREDKPTTAPAVRVIETRRGDVRMTLQGHGEVRPKVRSAIVPQVSGRIMAIHASLHPGGLVKKGEPLIELDPTDYDLAVRQAASEVATAKASLKSAEARIAETLVTANDLKNDLEKYRRLFDMDVANEREVDKARAAYEVAAAQLASAEADKASAEAQLAVAEAKLEQAGVNLQRTNIALPFDAVIVEESVDIGQFVRDGQSVGEAYGIEAVEIAVPVADRELAWLESLPLSALAQPTGDLPAAVVESSFAGRSCTWEGVVKRAEGLIDRRSRMVKLVVEVDKPFEVETSGQPPLVPGAFVKVTIQGKEVRDAIELPRHALREGDVVWIVREGRLHIAPVGVARIDRQHVYIVEGLEEGQKVVVTPLEVATEGMAVRVVTEAGDGQ